MYSPPGDLHAETLIDHLQQSVDLITTDHPDAGIVIAGDMNHLDITQLTTGGFAQVVTQPTRQGAILDKIITNISEYYKIPNIVPPIGQSDHNVVLWEPKPALHMHKPNLIQSRYVRPIKDSGLREFGQWIVNHKWEDIHNVHHVQAKCDILYQTLDDAIEGYTQCASCSSQV